MKLGLGLGLGNIFGGGGGAPPVPPDPTLISHWDADDLTVGLANSELWVNRVSDKPSLQRGDGIGKTRVVEVSAVFNNHKIINNTHVSGNLETEWTDGAIKTTPSDFTIHIVASIDGFNAGADSSLIEARNEDGGLFSFIWRATRASDSGNWSWIYTNDSPAWNSGGAIADMAAGEVHVYTLVLNSVTGNPIVYIDGVLKATYAGKWDNNYQLGDRLGICGSYSNTTLTGLYGKFAECRIRDVVQSDVDRNAEIDALIATYRIGVSVYVDNFGDIYSDDLDNIYIPN